MKKLIFLFAVMAVFIFSNAVASKGACPTDTIKPARPYIFTGGVTALTDITGTGPVWSSSNTSIATVGSTGLVTGIRAGTAVITYTFSGSCHSYKTITVHPVPNAPYIVLQKGTANFVTIDYNNYKRTGTETAYIYYPGDSTVAIYNIFNNRLIVPPTTDSFIIYFDSSGKRANNMLGIRTWLNANLE